MAGRASAQAALATRASILRVAADIASAEGLEGLSIGRLAAETQMSKSGVIGQFGSKEKLQLETADLAFGVFRDRVWEPVKHFEPGLPRLLALCDTWIAYAADPGFRGGCCMTQFTYEFDGRSGPVRERIERGLKLWRATLTSDIAAAVAAGDLPGHADPGQVAFGLTSIAMGITPARLLHRDASVSDWALHAMHAVLGLRQTYVGGNTARRRARR